MEGNINNHGMKPNRSLLISPNLDALLEHEERTRARVSSPVSEMTTSAPSSRSVSPSEEFLVGLPPPPRHPRVKLPRSTCAVNANLIRPEDTELQAPATPAKPAPISKFKSSSISNPYINPAPTLAELHDIPPKLLVTTKPSMNALSQCKPYDHDQLSELSSHRSHLRDSSPSPIIFTSPWSAVGEYSSQPSRPSAPRASKLLDPYDSYDVDGNPEDRQRQSSDSKSWRPLNSHAKRSSTFPGYTNTSSTHEPANTADKFESRISISSTVYPPSDNHSYPCSLYNDPVLSDSKSYPLSQSEFNLDKTSAQLSPIQFRRSGSWPSIPSDPLSRHSSKQDLPRPAFYSTFMKPGSRQLPAIPTASGAPLPPTTNFLDSGERADLVRKTRKLARVFGETPRADTIPAQEPSLSMMSRCSSVLNDLDWPILRRRPLALQSKLELDEVRRHSMPLSPDDVSLMTPNSQWSLSPSIEQAGHYAQVQIRSVDDISDGGDAASVLPEADNISKPLPSFPAQSQFETMLEEEQADEHRRRKRERLSKLHRFLGSRVPINLVLGADADVEASLPPPFLSPTSPLPRSEGPQSRTTWLQRRKSSSAILSSLHCSNDLERLKEELNEEEKHINVRRAVKMEKVFGVAPPQTLYHTRLCLSPLVPSDGLSPTGPVHQNPNRSTNSKQKPKKNGRPGTSDSVIHLLPKTQQTSDDAVNARGIGHSAIYNSYQHSLNSLHDILAWDDRESLVELHQYLNTEENPSLPLQVSPVATGQRMSNAPSFRRRRSLPVLTSRLSFDSEYSVASPKTRFQVRRRKAAKLTQFFGVDYRELINDVLSSIQNGVENEHKSGTLQAEEAEDLLAKLRNLKVKGRRSESFLCMD